jgi:hypothetical protein
MSVATKEHRIAPSAAHTVDITEIAQRLRTTLGQQLHELRRFLGAWSVTAPGVQLPNTDVGALSQSRSQHR